MEYSEGIFKALREQLVFDELQSQGINNQNVLEAMLKVPRHEFIPEQEKHLAYVNRALPIGYSQTISQPFIVATMTQAANLDKDSKVLEIGTGSGYQAAILGNICKEVYSIEVVEPLAKQATKVLKKLGYNNIHIRIGDGYDGWKENAPFDAIIVTAVIAKVPESLLSQLKIGGKLIIPVGEEYGDQELLAITKTNKGYETTYLMPVKFVPFI
ncbi:protein-L-isoaspartate O-methyltransferase [endosymbiont of Acanthamoeba sp. UWC8]|uniref:protein-L-isoaspartate(D-aspartate) O-methyltransferase n=1 Tax=endosymbiont of Acanthamoeba sp. UWC8 TaxID=86106 RepID=UPI0004D14A32|nr:protein-L-isoaspartate(D-aspartate) O-methyltransferase [endosymbiont of Acanthamoeba sp. UWC8]AIF80579.1 protein-L-isoaspartate O-methyltransferase [endosymbiont of Acanthamoeba sp. UWC8]